MLKHLLKQIGVLVIKWKAICLQNIAPEIKWITAWEAPKNNPFDLNEKGGLVLASQFSRDSELP